MPVPHRSRGWVWAGRIVAVLVLAGLGVYLARVGLDTADKLASSISAVIAVAALLAPYLLPPSSPSLPSPSPVPPVTDGGATAGTRHGQAQPPVTGDGVPLDLRGSNAPQINLTGGNTQNVTFGQGHRRVDEQTD